MTSSNKRKDEKGNAKYWWRHRHRAFLYSADVIKSTEIKEKSKRKPESMFRHDDVISHQVLIVLFFFSLLRSGAGDWWWEAIRSLPQTFSCDSKRSPFCSSSSSAPPLNVVVAPAPVIEKKRQRRQERKEKRREKKIQRIRRRMKRTSKWKI